MRTISEELGELKMRISSLEEDIEIICNSLGLDLRFEKKLRDVKRKSALKNIRRRE